MVTARGKVDLLMNFGINKKMEGTFAAHTCHPLNSLAAKEPSDDKRILQHINDFFKYNPTHNTDNMGKLFVTLFAFVPAFKTNL